MTLKQYQIWKTEDVYIDNQGKEYDCVMITFPCPPDNDFYIVDAIPCTEKGKCAPGFEVGTPCSVENFIELIQDVETVCPHCGCII